MRSTEAKKLVRSTTHKIQYAMFQSHKNHIQTYTLRALRLSDISFQRRSNRGRHAHAAAAATAPGYKPSTQNHLGAVSHIFGGKLLT